MKSRSAWFENGTEKARKLKKENSKRLIKSAILGNADIKVRTFVYQDRMRIFYAFRAKMGIFKQNKRKIGLRDGQTAVLEPYFFIFRRKK